MKQLLNLFAALNMIGNKKKKIYVAGPMTGYPKHNFPAFDYAKSRLEKDWIVISPADMDRAISYDPTGGDDLDHMNEQELREFTDDCIRRDVEVIQTVDALALLNGWEHSTGAKAEVMLAQWRGIPIYKFVDSMDELLSAPVGQLIVVEQLVIQNIDDQVKNLKQSMQTTLDVFRNTRPLAKKSDLRKIV